MSVMTSGRVETRRRQVGLRALALWVVGAAVFFALVRGAHGFWMDWLATVPKRPMLDLDRVAGVFLLAMVSLIAAWLGADAIRRARSAGRTVFGVAWRVAAVALLVAMALVESSRLADVRDPMRLGVFVLSVFESSPWRMKLATLSLTVGTIGVLLGVVPARAARGFARRRWVFPSIVLAAAAGVAVVAFWPDSVIPYLVILALEAVNNAITRPAEWAGIRLLGQAVPVTDPWVWRSLDSRLMVAGAEAGVALISAILTAHWLARDLRRRADEPVAPRSRWGTVYRVATAAATWAIGAWLYVAVDRLHPSLAAGFRDLLFPSWTLLVAGAFAALAAGLTARGLAPVAVETRPAPPERLRARRLVLVIVKVVLIAGLVLVIGSAVAQIRGGDTLPWYAVRPLSEIVGAVSLPLTITTPGAIYLDPDRTPDVLFLLGGVAILAALAVRFLLADHRPEADAPIDRIGRDRPLMGRFLGDWLALMGVIFALFPAFFLAGMEVLHVAMKAYHG